MKKRKFTYTLLIAPELVGPVFWLKKNIKRIKNFKYALLLKSVGNNNTIKLQHSSAGNSEIDNLATKYLKKSKEKYISGKFRSIYGNDEIIFDSPGYNIKTISLTRYPFREYHTDHDTPEKISKKHLNKSYNILSHAKFINNLNEIKNILLFFNIKSPEALTNKILAMTSMLSTYKHQDSSLPLFNGCNNNHNDQIEKILSKELFLKTRSLTKFKNGIAVYRDTNKTLFFDVVQPSKFNYHKELSAGSLALEISALGERIITNCGGAEINAKNSTYLKYSAAHSTIVINNTNISEIMEGNINKTFPKKVIFESKDLSENIILTGTHNGYLKNYSKICKRELIIDTINDKLRGKDTIISAKSLIEKYVFHIRFHLTPNISTIITENKKNIIIRTKKNNMWLFKSDNEVLIEKSIYVEEDVAIETSQIVITGITSTLKNSITWSLEKI